MSAVEQGGAAGQPGVAARDEGVGAFIVKEGLPADIGRPRFAAKARKLDGHLGAGTRSLEQGENNR